MIIIITHHTPHTSHAPELNNLFLRLSASAAVTAERASQILTGTMKIWIKIKIK